MLKAVKELIRERHQSAMRALLEAVTRHVPNDQRAILIVYDGPQAVTRELSWSAPGQNPDDVLRVFEAVVKQMKQDRAN